MQNEQNQDYKPPKTAKLFFSTLQIAYLKRDAARLAKEIRNLYFTKLYDNVPQASWGIAVNVQAFNDGESSMIFSFGKIVELMRDFALQRSGGRWAQCFEKHMQILRATLKVLQELKQTKDWLVPSLLLIVRATKRIFLTAEMKVNNSSVAAKLKNNLFNTLQTYKTAKALEDRLKKQFLSLVDVMQVSILLTFHNYQQIQRIIYSPKNYEMSHRCIDNFLFQKGKYALVNENLLQAEQCFMKINLKSRGQKKLVLNYLIPCRILLGRLYQPSPNDKSGDFAEYIQIIKAIKTADFKAYEQLNKKYQKVWLKRGIYLLMDRIRIILWRNLVKYLFIMTSNKIDLELIERAVRSRGGRQSLSECICIVANLIYEGYIKGYIFQSQTKRTLVLKSSGSAFPKLDSIAK